MSWLARLLKSLAEGTAVLSPNCRQASRLQAKALNHKLPPLQRIGLRIHLFLCEWCRRYGKHIRFLHGADHEHPAGPPGPPRRQLPDTVREQIKQRLQVEKEQSDSQMRSQMK